MKKQALRAVTMLVSIIALAFATAVVSSAQARVKKIKADIPFDFVVGDKTLAAGQYLVGQITTNSDAGILIRNSEGGQNAIRLTNTVAASATKRKNVLTFRHYGNTYFLAQVWLAGSAEGREVLKSKAERSVERELARNSSRSNLAQNSKAEVVTIIAEIE
ncbi:MAG: hypothetical protein QOH25_1684 [Acidobacteriota bacterium]|nr:hypothetical protein [Acidobacteriota bacterium]